MCFHLNAFFLLSYISHQSLPTLYAIFVIFFECHRCDYVSFFIPQLESPHNSFLIVQGSCVHQQSVFGELRKSNCMLRYLTSLTHLLISSRQLLALFSRSSPALGALCVSGGVFWHVPGEVPAVLELAALLPSASVSLRVSLATELVDGKYVA